MKPFRIGIVLFVFFLIGITIFTHSLIGQEENINKEEILNKGNRLVSLIGLLPIRDFDSNKHNFFLRTLSEYTSYEGLVYCFIHDNTGHILVSLAPSDIELTIPDDIGMRSLSSMGSTKQTFSANGSKNTIYEFSKPVYEKGKRTGTIRIGLKLPAVTIFTPKRISLWGIISFITFAAITFVYYGLTLALKPLEKLKQNIKGTWSTDSPETIKNLVKDAGISTFIEDFQHSLIQFKEKLDKIETNNRELASKLGVITFEKNQTIKILDSMNFGIIITDIQNNVNHCNDYMLNLLNKKRADVMDHPLGEILEHDEITSFISQQETQEQTSMVNHIETTFPELAPGEKYKISLSYIADGEGAPIGKMILFNNITGEKSTAKAMQEFIAHLSHELLTPLTTIKSYSEMLMDGEVDDSEAQKEFYNTINGETDRLTHLIKNILNISKIEVGSLIINKELVKTDLFYEDCITAVEGAAQKKNIVIERDLPDNFPALVGDKELLKGAIINILGNAVKYSPEESHITFSISEKDKMVIFDITDTGHGISEEDCSHIFDKFYRSSNPKIAEQQGTGLGLSIASEIVKLHHGKIEVTSELLKGTHFTVRIPKGEHYIGK